MTQEPIIPLNQNQQPYRPPNSVDLQSSRHNRKREGTASILSTVLVIIVALVAAWLMATFVFQSYEVDGQSMETTLSNKDRLIVLKTERTWARITGNDYIPERYDIVVFTSQSTNGYSNVASTRQLIKRVIGLPGERVIVSGGNVKVYNQIHPNGFNPDAHQEYAQDIVTTSGEVDITIPRGEVFVLGDNRSSSQDSRYFGTVPAENIAGHLIFRLLPIHRAEAF